MLKALRVEQLEQRIPPKQSFTTKWIHSFVKSLDRITSVARKSTWVLTSTSNRPRFVKAMFPAKKSAGKIMCALNSITKCERAARKPRLPFKQKIFIQNPTCAHRDLWLKFWTFVQHLLNVTVKTFRHKFLKRSKPWRRSTLCHSVGSNIGDGKNESSGKNLKKSGCDWIRESYWNITPLAARGCHNLCNESQASQIFR